MKLSLVNSSENSIDPLLIFAAMVAIFVVGFVAILSVMKPRSPGHHPQVSGHQGTNIHDASTTSKSSFTNNGEINIGVPRSPKLPDRSDDP